MIGGVSRGRDRLEQAEAGALHEQHVDLTATSRDRGGTAREHGRERFGVVMVVVCEHDAAEAAALGDSREDALQVLLEQRAGVDQPGGRAALQPGVRPRQRQRPGVRRAQAQDVVRREQLLLGA